MATTKSVYCQKSVFCYLYNRHAGRVMPNSTLFRIPYNISLTDVPSQRKSVNADLSAAQRIIFSNKSGNSHQCIRGKCKNLQPMQNDNISLTFFS